ncbi:MAG: cytochrome C [Ghiorsea sp.]
MKTITATLALTLFLCCSAPHAQAAALSKCQFCHKITASHNIGPSLKHVFEREAGTTNFSKYSESLKKGGWKWDETHLRQWMCNSTNAIKSFADDRSAHTKMPAQHICDSSKQDAIIKALMAL